MNKYAICCDSLEDEQLLKDWIKKESEIIKWLNNTEFYMKQYYFHFPAVNCKQNFVWGSHSWSEIQKGYTKINIKDFLKEYNKMNKTELLGLPIIKGEKYHLEAFCKDCEKFGHNGYISKDEEDLTLIYNNFDEQTILRSGIAFKTLFVGRIGKDPVYNNFTKNKIFQFQLPQDWSKALDFMKENMDRWNKIQEENKQPEFKIGDIVTILKKPTNWDSGAGGIYPLDNENPVIFPFTGKIEHIVVSDRKSYKISKYGFSSKTEMRHATPQEIEEYNKPKFKMGDYVIASNSLTSYIGIYKSGVTLSKWKPVNQDHITNCNGDFDKIERLATLEEIEQFNNVPKIFKMTSSSGDFELEVFKKGIYYRPEDKWLDTKKSWNTTTGDPFTYNIVVEKINVGCKKDTLIKEWKAVYDYYKSIV